VGFTVEIFLPNATISLKVMKQIGVMMAFSEDVIIQAWKRSSGKCECKRWKHNHNYGRCNAQLLPAMRGREGQGKWGRHTVLTAKVMIFFQIVKFSVGIAISEICTSNNAQGPSLGCPALMCMFYANTLSGNLTPSKSLLFRLFVSIPIAEP